MRKGALAAFTVVACMVPAAACATDYVQAAGSTLQFSTRYQGEPVVGRFAAFSTRFAFDPAHLADARLDVTIPLAGASTGNAEYDGELRGGSFFDAGRFVQARYSANRFRSLGGNRYAADGLMELRGVRKPVTLTFTWTPGANPVLIGQASVSRLLFGVGSGDWADTALIPDRVAVRATVRFTRAP